MQEVPSYHGKHFQVDNAYNKPRPVQKPRPPIMLGGSGTGLLRIAAREADILNIIPPTSNGKDFVNDPAATVAFDTPKLKERIALFREFLDEAGRPRDAVELGGLLLLGLSNTPQDPALVGLASHLGFPDYATAQRSPVALLGTPAEVREELATRIADTGVTYFIMLLATVDTHILFANEVMPAFQG